MDEEHLFRPSAQPENFTLREEEELSLLQSDHTLNMRFTDLSLYKFWISLEEWHPAIHRQANCCSFLLLICVSKFFFLV